MSFSYHIQFSKSFSSSIRHPNVDLILEAHVYGENSQKLGKLHLKTPYLGKLYHGRVVCQIPRELVEVGGGAFSINIWVISMQMNASWVLQGMLERLCN